MITDRNKFNGVTICCWLSLFALTATFVNGFSLQQNQQQQRQQTIKDEGHHQQDAAAGAFESTRIFNPRMDYNNEWRPVGRGDPLKNDPTYDYSPPALERVRYWADTADKDAKPEDGAGDTKTTASSKNDVLLLGGSSVERPRPAAQNALQNAKGELPLLQPKYTSIRRSYYAQQLPTHLMPPPMQTLAIAPHNSLMKAAGEYRQSMPAGFTGSSSSPSIPGMYSKSHYSTTGTSPWMYSQSQAQAHAYSHSAAPPTTTTTTRYAPHSMPMGHAFDSHHQESANYLSYTRPSTAHTSEISYSPNSIRPSQNTFKTGSISPRKPWVHELLQKELIKPLRPTMPATKYLMSPGPTHSNYNSVPYVHSGISTTFAPVNFVTAATSTSPSRQPIISTPPPISHTSSPVYLTSTTLPTTTTSTTTTTTTTKSPIYSATRLLIPETSNMAFRPTVAPMEMTTDSLFAHYNQPDKPLLGPMYLIIEGHSKVKTYGKNELDPHQPKIVPIIPKREPIVRVADPNELRGSVETFQVKHLHTKKAPATTTTTPTTKRMTTKAAATTTTTTAKPNMSNRITTKPTTPKTTAKLTIMKTTTKPPTVKNPPSLKPSMMTTTLRPQASIRSTTTSTVSPTTTAKLITTAFRPTIPTTKSSSTIPSRTEKLPPTGMQGLLSLLDDSLSSIFRDEPTDRESELVERPQLNARVATKGETIAAEDDFDPKAQEELQSGINAATELPPRGVRQIFDYDQLPDSRLKQRLENFNYDDDDTKTWMKSAVYSDDEEYEDSLDEGIKRYDKVMDYNENDDKRKEKGQEEDEEDEYEDDDDETDNKVSVIKPIFEDVKDVKNPKLVKLGQEA